MKVTVGTDIIEVKRIEEAFENDKFANTVFTDKEIEYCESKNASKYQHYAARFAAKEAVFKAISSCLENKYDLNWTDIEVINDALGKPKVKLNKKVQKINEIKISLSHCNEYAVANILITFFEKSDLYN